MSAALTRRQALAAAAAAPVAATLAPGLALAAAPMQGATMRLSNRFTLGAFEVTALLSGTRTVEKPKEIFGLNASDEDFAAATEGYERETDN